MSVRPLERYASDDDDLKSPYLVHCKVGAGMSDKGAMRDLEFTLVLGSVTGQFSVWRMADDIAGYSPFRGAVDGVPGWVNRKMAGVLLPSACEKSLQVGGPPYLRIEANNDQEDTWKDGKLQERMAAVLMKAAMGVTEKLHCSAPSFTVPKTVPELVEPRPLDPGAACGLPGFAPLRPSAPAFEEYVTPGDARLWSCAIRFPDDPDGVVNFTVTQDPRLTWFFPDEGPGRTVLTCSGRRTLLQSDRFDRSDAMSGAEHVRPREELSADFEKAVRESSLC
ncbi:hypothetical protein RM717_31160 [Streptomyces griseus]|uniref:Uncharacterized protein n=1 Tax=Streptomyces stephensoniae TaxID=3375367 RepID=A0ABU2WAR4_9ACTN|nr:hypothetical protein [Streptomyces griseus]MDT0494961.1 hypothetical protein [Streptomyces griseus]